MKLTRITGIYTLLGEDDKMIASDDADMQKDYQIGKLSKQNCDEIFGIVDVEKLAMGYDLYEKINFVGQTRAYKAGFNKAIELNKDKLFTLEDIKKAIDKAKQGSVKETHNGYGIPTEPRFVLDDLSYDEIIQSLQQPTEIEVEIETETKVWEFISNGEFESFEIIPKLDSNGCIILKKL
jgi:hypothetical protein